MRTLDIFQHLGDDVRDADEPGRYGAVNQGSVRAPTKRITMSNLAVYNKSLLFLEMLDNPFICGLQVKLVKP